MGHSISCIGNVSFLVGHCLYYPSFTRLGCVTVCNRSFQSFHFTEDITWFTSRLTSTFPWFLFCYQGRRARYGKAEIISYACFSRTISPRALPSVSSTPRSSTPTSIPRVSLTQHHLFASAFSHLRVKIRESYQLSECRFYLLVHKAPYVSRFWTRKKIGDPLSRSSRSFWEFR